MGQMCPLYTKKKTFRRLLRFPFSSLKTGNTLSASVLEAVTSDRNYNLYQKDKQLGMTAAGWAIWHDKNWGSTARIMHWSSWECKHKSMLHAYGGQYCMLLQCFRVIVYSIHLYKVSKCHLFINLFKLNSILGGTECPKPGSQKKISWAKTRYIHNYIV